MLSPTVNNSVILDTIATLSKNKKQITYLYVTACMYKNSSTPSNNTALWHYSGTKNLDFRCENKSTLGVLNEKIRYLYVVK